MANNYFGLNHSLREQARSNSLTNARGSALTYNFETCYNIEGKHSTFGDAAHCFTGSRRAD